MKICRGSDCQLQKCVPTITQQLLQSIIRGRIEKKIAKIFNCLSNQRKQWQGGCSVCTRAHWSELVMSKANWTAVVAIYNFEIGLSPSNLKLNTTSSSHRFLFAILSQFKFYSFVTWHFKYVIYQKEVAKLDLKVSLLPQFPWWLTKHTLHVGELVIRHSEGESMEFMTARHRRKPHMQDN